MSSYTGAKVNRKISSNSPSDVANRSGNTVKSRKQSLMLVLIVGIFCISMVFMSAFAANLKKQNNELQEENEYIQAEIDAIEAKISSVSNISTIESTAINKLGMIYTDNSNLVTLTNSDESDDINLASTIKEEAYE